MINQYTFDSRSWIATILGYTSGIANGTEIEDT